MAIVESFPYSNQHNLNLDWMISKLNEYAGEQIVNIEVETIDASHFRFKFTYASGGVAYTDPISMVGGPQGPSGTITVGTVTTVDPTDPATVTNSGTNTAAIFDFEIPKGAKGDTGATGATGAPGGITDIDGYTGPVTTSDGIDFDTSTGIIKTYDLNLNENLTKVMNTCTYDSNIIASISSDTLNFAFNGDRSIGKVYGYFNFTFTSNLSTYQLYTIGTGIKVPAPAAAYNIIVGAYGFCASWDAPNCPLTLRIASDGEILIGVYASSARNGKNFQVGLPACLYFFKDFGDNP